MPCLNNTTFFLRKFILPILISCGFILNMFSFLVMKRIKGSTAKYMSFLGLVDSCVLLLGGVNLWLHSVNYNSLPMATVIGCKLVPFLFYSLADYSVLIIVVMTGERFYGIWKPYHAKQINKKRLFKINLIGGAFFCSLVNLHFVFTHSLVEQDDLVFRYYNSSQVPIELDQPKKNKICAYIIWKTFYEKYWIFIDASIYSFIPFMLITIFNILIIGLLNKAEKTNFKLSESVKSLDKKSKSTYESSQTFCSKSFKRKLNREKLEHSSRNSNVCLD